MIHRSVKLLHILATIVLFASCSNEKQKTESTSTSSTEEKKQPVDASKFQEGSDYMIFERARIMDRQGFDVPVEAYSILLPKGWTTTSEIIWIAPGNSCQGTYRKFKAQSPDGKYSLEMLPDLLFTWNSDQQLTEFQQQHSDPSSFCSVQQPMNAEKYLQELFVPTVLENATIKEVKSNQSVIDQMRQQNEKAVRELQQYGGGQMQFDQTAVNATVKWNDGNEAFVILGVTSVGMAVPNNYTGTYSQMYNTQITKRTIFKYPAGEETTAKNLFSVIMGSFRSNPSWENGVNDFWKQARQRSNQISVGQIRVMDEQTRRIGEQAIRNGNERLAAMDNEMRSWEQQQNSQDRMHTNFIKTIREVENFRDETGKYEMVSGYNHAWSRGDGRSFILSDNPNFDPSFVLQDQNWKEMKKVDN